MDDTSLPVLDSTVQMTHLWLKRLMTDHHFANRHEAYIALRAVLHALRDRLTPEQAVHLAAQLPMLVRGLYYEGWRLSGKAALDRHLNEFLEHVSQELPPKFPRDALSVSKAVFDLLWNELDPGETAKVIDHLPVALRGLWPALAQR